jgi:hypothetical protein
MNGMPKWAAPAVVIPVWIACLYTIEPLTDSFDGEALLFVGYTFAAGLLVGRWWVVPVPFATIALLFAFDATNPCEECREELEWLGQLFLGAVLAGAAAIVLAAAVGVRRAVAAVRKR